MDEETSSGQPISGVCLLGCCDSCRPKPIVISSWWLKEGKDLPRIHFIDTWNNERPGRYPRIYSGYSVGFKFCIPYRLRCSTGYCYPRYLVVSGIGSSGRNRHWGHVLAVTIITECLTVTVGRLGWMVRRTHQIYLFNTEVVVSNPLRNRTRTANIQICELIINERFIANLMKAQSSSTATDCLVVDPLWG